mmetsp:Transcript_99659/g.281291  ORF Transcript_99659/g.281291 Transcript_99659/m.281291 type:complete len:794 (-) Transcript_99659:206-2587(-)
MADAVEEDDGVVIEELDNERPLEAGQEVEPGPESGDEGVDNVQSGTEAAMAKIEEEKKTMTVVEKLERSILWKAEGNGFFKAGELIKAVDAYYHVVLYCRDLTQNPKYYPKIGHDEAQRQQARDLCESAFTNLALAQAKYCDALAPDDPECVKVLEEAAKSATEALKLNPKNVKALYRRAIARVALQKRPGMKCAEAQGLLGDAKADLLAALEEDPKNRDARNELKAVQDRLKQLKREELQSERREFKFGSTLSALSAKEKDLLGDGSVRKQQTSVGDGGLWFNEDWLRKDSAKRCVVHVKCAMLSSGGDSGSDAKSTAAPVSISFVLGDGDMHNGMTVAVKSMTVGEVARFTFTPMRLAAEGALAKALPDPQGQTSVWEVTFVKFAIWEDLGRDGDRLLKIASEGYGEVPDNLAEVHVHWKVLGPTGELIHSSRYTLNVGGEGGLTHREDEDKEAPVYVMGENIWEPLAALCGHLRQGGVGELRARRLPPLPQEEGNGDLGASAKLSMMLNKGKDTEKLRHCVLRAELERVVQPLSGPDDRRWEGPATLVQERFLAEQLLEKGEEVAALARLRRAVSWVERMPPEDAAGVREELAHCRASIGWALASRAAVVLDLGSVTSDLVAAANRDLAEAESHCAWLEERCPSLASTKLLRAKILLAQDEDFNGAHEQLLEAQRIAPDDRRVQEELRRVKVELRKQQEEKSKAKVVEIREGLKRARVDDGAESREATVLALLRELSATKVSWDTVMDTRIGVELKSCQEGCGDEAKRLCLEILGRLKDESKEQRPMWDS